MNIRLINLDYTEWSREDWTDAYTAYCKTNMFGPKTKKEYYDMVVTNFEKLAKKPEFHELNKKWLQGWRNAIAYAKKHKCNMNGELLENCHPEINLEDLQNDVKELQWQMMHK